MKCVITGANGDLGRFLVEHLSSQSTPNETSTEKFEIFAMVRAGSNKAPLEKFPIQIVNDPKNLPKEVPFWIDCATNYGRNKEDPSAVWTCNLERAQNVWHLAAQKKAQKTIWIDTRLPRSANVYAESKASFRDWAQSEHQKLKNPKPTQIFLRLEHFYGSFEKESKFLSWFTRRLLLDAAPIALSSGKQKRNFVHIEDVLQAIRILLMAPIAPEHFAFDLGAEDVWPLRKILENLTLLAQQDLARLHFGEHANNTYDDLIEKLNLEPLKSLGWKQKYSLQEGLDAHMKIYRQNLQRSEQ